MKLKLGMTRVLVSGLTRAVLNRAQLAVKKWGSIIQCTRVSCLERFVMIKKLKESQIIFCLVHFPSLSFVQGFEQFTCKPVLDPNPPLRGYTCGFEITSFKSCIVSILFRFLHMQQFIASCFFPNFQIHF